MPIVVKQVSLRGGRDLQGGCLIVDADEVQGGLTICDFLTILIDGAGEQFAIQNNAGHGIFNRCCNQLSGDSEPECCVCFDSSAEATYGWWRKTLPDGSCPTEGGTQAPVGLLGPFEGSP